MKEILLQKKHPHILIKFVTVILLAGALLAVFMTEPYYVEHTDLSSGRWEEGIKFQKHEDGHIEYVPVREYVYTSNKGHDSVIECALASLGQGGEILFPSVLFAISAILCAVTTCTGRMGIAALSNIGACLGVYSMPEFVNLYDGRYRGTISGDNALFDMVLCVLIILCGMILFLALNNIGKTDNTCKQNAVQSSYQV